MGRRCRLSLRSGTESSWECGSASGCFGSWDFDFASRVQLLPMQTSNCRSGIKKLKALRQDSGVDLWAGDEVHFQQFGSRCRMGCSGSSRPRPLALSHPQECRLLWGRSTARWQARLPAATAETKFNGETCFEFLKHLKQCASRSGRRAVVIMDNATYHHARLHKPWRNLHAAHFQLYFLPPYSPELNPIERVWKLTRRKCLHNQHFSTLDQVVETVEQQFRLWNTANSTLTKLCAIT